MSLRVLIVDDESLARRGVRARLARAEGVEIVGECSSGHAAVEAVRDLAPDLVFLDVQMSGLDGFGVAEALRTEPRQMPVVVFVTAYDEHALRAFEAEALDYLLKPIDDERFERSLARARRRVAEQRESALVRGVTAALGTASVTPRPTAERSVPDARFLVERSGRVAVVHADDVDWVEAAGDYVTLHVGRDAHLLRETMTRMEERLGSAFVRIHRSTTVRVDHIRELRPYFNRECIVVLRDGTELKLSRSYRVRLEAVFGTDF